MQIGILGSGVVGQTLGEKLASIGHQVALGTRHPDALDDERSHSGSLRDWLGRTQGRGRVVRFDEAAAHGEVVINATSGTGSLSALEMAGSAHLANKILIDVSNPLDFSKGFPPSLTICNTDSLAEQIQRAYPQTRVVKTLNTVPAALMVDPARVAGGDHHLFLAGNDAAARETVAEYLRAWFGWREIIDLGDLTGARGMEMYLPLWVRLYGARGSALFNVRLVG